MLTFVTTRNYDVTDIRIQSDTNELREFLNQQSCVGIDIETNSLDPLIAQIFLLSIGNGEHQYVIDVTSVSIDFLNEYSHLLFVGQNIKYDYTVLKWNKIHLKHLYDTMIVEQRLGMGSGRKNSLDAIVLRRLGITMKMNKEETRSSFINFNGIFTNNQIIYSGEDVEHLLAIKTIQEKYIDKFSMQFLIYDIEFPLISILGDCELTGLVINQEGWIKIIKEKEQEQQDLKKQLYGQLDLSEYSDILKYTFRPKIRKSSIGLWSQKLRINFNSSAQLKTIFTVFGEDIPIGTRRNSEGEFEETETVGVKNIQLYLKQKPDTKLKEFLEIFIKYKKIEKHLSSFGYNYINMISPITGRLHTVYKQCFTETGRLSCGDTRNAGKPNLQQIPKFKELRKCFGYLEGYRILTIDLTGAELVILGSKAQDFKLIELNEGDMHSYLAQASWRKILKDDTYVISNQINKDKRTEFKNVNYGILYGATSRKIAEVLNVDTDAAQLVVDTLNEEIPNTFRYMDNASRSAIQNGFIEFNERTHSRRWFVNRSNVGAIKRAAINSPIQGTQADMIKESMVEIHKVIKQNNFDSLLLMQVHDELVYAFKDDNFPKIVHKIMVDTANKYLDGVEMRASYVTEDTWTKE